MQLYLCVTVLLPVGTSLYSELLYLFTLMPLCLTFRLCFFSSFFFISLCLPYILYPFFCSCQCFTIFPLYISYFFSSFPTFIFHICFFSVLFSVHTNALPSLLPTLSSVPLFLICFPLPFVFSSQIFFFSSSN